MRIKLTSLTLDFAEMLVDPILHLPPAEPGKEQKERRERLKALQDLSRLDEAQDNGIKSPDHTVVDGKKSGTETLLYSAPDSTRKPVQKK